MIKQITFLYLTLVNLAFSHQIIDLFPYEVSYVSQFGEDGVIEKIFQIIEPTSKYCVDFGAGNGHTWSNSKYLTQTYDWKALLMDDRFEDLSINLHKEFITPSNINDLFQKYEVPEDLDLLSIDIDFNDFYVFYALKYRPKVVIVEFNTAIPSNEDKVVKIDENFKWDCTSYHSASILAFQNLAEKKGYSLVYQPLGSVNLILVRKDLIPDGIAFKDADNPEKLYRKHTNKYKDPLNRELISSKEAMKLIDDMLGV